MNDIEHTVQYEQLGEAIPTGCSQRFPAVLLHAVLRVGNQLCFRLT